MSVGHIFAFLPSHFTFVSGSDFKTPVLPSRRVSDLPFATPISMLVLSSRQVLHVLVAPSPSTYAIAGVIILLFCQSHSNALQMSSLI